MTETIWTEIHCLHAHYRGHGTAPFVPTLLAGIVLIVMHWVLASLALRMHWVSATVKGTRISLIRARCCACRSTDDDPSKVEVAYMERSGQISVIPRR